VTVSRYRRRSSWDQLGEWERDRKGREGVPPEGEKGSGNGGARLKQVGSLPWVKTGTFWLVSMAAERAKEGQSGIESQMNQSLLVHPRGVRAVSKNRPIRDGSKTSGKVIPRL